MAKRRKGVTIGCFSLPGILVSSFPDLLKVCVLSFIFVEILFQNVLYLKKILTKVKFKLTIALICCCLFSTFVTSQVSEMWKSRYTSTGNNVDGAADIVINGPSQVFVTGTSWNGSNFDYLTVKYDGIGNQLWASSYNGAGNGFDEVRAIALDASGNVYVTGFSEMSPGNYDYATVKYNSLGAQLWVATYNGTGNGFDEGYDLAVDASGNVYVTGGSDGGGSSSNYVTVMYNSLGVQQWASTYNGTGNSIDVAYALVLDGLNNVYITGQSTGAGTDFDYATVKYNSSGVQQWAVRYNGTGNLFDGASSLVLDQAGNVYVTGFSYDFFTDNDIATIQYSNGGVEQWVRRYNGSDDEADKGNDIAADLTGVYVTGKARGIGSAEDYITIKYSFSGVQLWDMLYNGPAGNNYDEATAIKLLDNGVYITGFSYGVGTNNDYTTIKYDTTGNQLWQIKYDGPLGNSDRASSMILDGLGNVYITGKSFGIGTGEDYATIKYCQLQADAGTDTVLCVGDSIQLNALGGVVYEWTPSAGLSDTTISNPWASPVVNTTYTVEVTNANGCTDTDTITILVNPLPGPTITAGGPTNFCDGESVILIADTNAFYLWNTGETTQSITVDTTATYTVTVMDSMGCMNSTGVNVTVYPLPNADAGVDTSICFGDSIQLNASGGITYAWNPTVELNDTTIADPWASPSDTATYYVTVSNPFGCINSDSVTINVWPLPTPPIISYIPPQLVSTPAVTYQWYLNAVPINGATSQTHTPIFNGDYTVIINDANGCYNASVIYNITGIGISEEHASDDILLYPNPTTGKFTVSSAQGAKTNAVLLLYDITGRAVFRQEVTSNQQQVDVSSLTEGLYLWKLSDKQGTATSGKLVKQ